jgi:glyoxylate/hydroxypyruvate reductase A
MSIALVITDRDLTRLADGIKTRLPEVKVQCWPNIDEPNLVEFAIFWHQPENIFSILPNLKVVSSFGAGCDGVFKYHNVPEHVRVTRIVDPNLATQMADYVLMQVLIFSRQIKQYFMQQQEQRWQMQKKARIENIAILGVGEIGKVVAEKLMLNGFSVTGWARTAKENTEFTVYHGKSMINSVLEHADVVVNLLPNTTETHQLINKNIFDKMKSTAFFINVGRGQTVDEQDLINALENNLIAGAALDVFQQEPLPKQSRLWSLENVLITPHVSAITSQKFVVEQICTNYERMHSKQPLLNEVNKKIGY